MPPETVPTVEEIKEVARKLSQRWIEELESWKKSYTPPE
jgi:hypothetical protein